MCTGPTHATFGLVSGIYAADVYGSIVGQPLSPWVTVTAGMLAAGGALLPDLDNTSTATSSFGWATRQINHGVRGLSRAVFNATATRVDHKHTTGRHRGLTHTFVSVPVLGILVGAACDTWGKPAILTTLFLVLFLALRGLPPESKNLTDVILAATGTGLAWLVLPPDTSGLLVGGAVAVGALSHILLDGCTTNGVPLFWPIQIRGQRWLHVGLPRVLRFHTSSGMETLVFFAFAAVAIVQLINLTPGGHDAMAAGFPKTMKPPERT